MQKRMNRKAVQFDWNCAKAFLATAEDGSLSAAARTLGVTQPTLGRLVAALEKELGVPLFERRGRGLELTPNGLALMDHVRAMGEAASSLSLAASGQSESIEGNVCISASEVMAAFALPAVMRKLRKQLPDIDVTLVVSNSASDLKGREADIAVRLFAPTQGDLIAKKIGMVSGQMYATPAYLQSIGNPSKPTEFGQASFIGFEDNHQYLNFLKGCGFVDLTARNFPLTTDNRIVQWELVKPGLGIGVMQESVGEAERTVTRALPHLDRAPGEMWLVAHSELRTSRRIRSVFDFLASELVY